jgi:hypothetical protein
VWARKKEGDDLLGALARRRLRPRDGGAAVRSFARSMRAEGRGRGKTGQHATSRFGSVSASRQCLSPAYRGERGHQDDGIAAATRRETVVSRPVVRGKLVRRLVARPSSDSARRSPYPKQARTTGTDLWRVDRAWL